MEKYSKWTDDATGLNPFTPIQGGIRSGAIHALATGLLGPLLFLLRLPAFLVAATFFTVLDLVVTIAFAWIRPLQFILHRVVHQIFGTMLLWTAGVFTVAHKRYDHTMRLPTNQTIPSGPKATTTDGTHSGDSGSAGGRWSIIISNFSTWVDVVQLATRFSPRFVTIGWRKPESTISATPKTSESATVPDLDDSVRVFSSAGTMLLAYLFGNPERFHRASTDDECRRILKSSDRPTVVFAEGTRTNANGVLQFHPRAEFLLAAALDQSENAAKRFLITGFAYPSKHNTPTHSTAESFIRHFYRISSAIYHSAVANWIQGDDFPFVRLPGDSNASTAIDRVKLCRGYLANILRTKETQIYCTDKASFEEYWRQTSTKRAYRSKRD